MTWTARGELIRDLAAALRRRRNLTADERDLIVQADATLTDTRGRPKIDLTADAARRLVERHGSAEAAGEKTGISANTIRRRLRA